MPAEGLLFGCVCYTPQTLLGLHKNPVRAIIPTFQRRKLRHREVVACPEPHSLRGQGVTQSCSPHHQLKKPIQFPVEETRGPCLQQRTVRNKPVCGWGEREVEAREESNHIVLWMPRWESLCSQPTAKNTGMGSSHCNTAYSSKTPGMT